MDKQPNGTTQKDDSQGVDEENDEVDEDEEEEEESEDSPQIKTSHELLADIMKHLNRKHQIQSMQNKAKMVTYGMIEKKKNELQIEYERL